jgi:hypothetical protein
VGALAYAIESNNGGGPQFHIYDVTDPAAIVLLGRIYTTNSYLRDLHVVGHHAFVAADDWNDFFDVIDVTDPRNPVLEQSVVLREGGISLFASQYQVLVGLVANGGFEFEIYGLRAP